MARTKVSSGRAARSAAGVVPDPAEHAAPPPEDKSLGEAPWEEGAETFDIDAGEAPAEAAAPARAKSASQQGAGRGWGAVIETALTLDPEAMYARLYDELRLGDDATEYGAVLAACDRAEQNALDAVRLSRHAKLEDELVTRKANERLEVLRSSAKRELEAEVAASYDEKLKKTTKKAPTIQDIEDRVVANWPDEFASISRRKEEMHGVLRVAEGLVDSWRSRCATLRMILDRVAPTRPR